jgi:hypothetical protein
MFLDRSRLLCEEPQEEGEAIGGVYIGVALQFWWASIWGGDFLTIRIFVAGKSPEYFMA